MTSHSSHDGRLPPREWVTATSEEAAPGRDVRSFSLITYNILADCHISPNKYPNLSRDGVKMVNRHNTLMEELAIYHGDIVCLQEVGVDYVYSLLTPAMNELGYQEGPFIQRELGTEEGEATFYRSDRWNLLDQRSLVLNDKIKELIDQSDISEDKKVALYNHCEKDTILSMMKFESKSTGNIVVVANTHGLYGQFMRNDLCTLHYAICLTEISRFCGDQQNTPVLLAGDFNIQHLSLGYKFLQNGRLDDDDISELARTSEHALVNGDELMLTTLFRDKYIHGYSSLKSAYNTVDSEPPITQYASADGIGLKKLCLDYIWYTSDTLRAVAVLRPHPESLLEPLKSCPNQLFASDHFLMKAEFEFI